MNQLIGEFSSNRALRLAGVAVLVLLALFLLVTTWDKAFGRSISDPYNTITVEGTGTAAMVPDTARITFTVTESAVAVADAQDAATKKTDAALAALAEMGIEERDVKTLSYNVSPTYEYDQRACFGMVCPPSTPRITGYDVSQTIEVKVRDTSMAGEALAGLGALGVQNISGPQFVVDDETAVQNEARAEAIEEAREKAKRLAKDLNVRLGDIVSFSEGNPGEMYGYGAKGGMTMDAALQSAPSLPTGESETKITVMITYEIR